MHEPFFSPFDLVIPDFGGQADVDFLGIFSLMVHKLHSSHWSAVHSRIMRETRCASLADLAVWLDVGLQEARRVMRDEQLPLEWLKRLYFRGWFNPCWILGGLLPKYVPYKVPARDSCRGKQRESHIASIARDLNWADTFPYGMFLYATQTHWTKMEEYREQFNTRRPEWAKAFLMAARREASPDGERVIRTRRVFLRWSPHTRNSFPELRKAAGLFAPTAFLAAEVSGEWERQKTYGAEEGAGTTAYLADSDYGLPGWKVRKVWICSGTDPRLEWEASE